MYIPYEMCIKLSGYDSAENAFDGTHWTGIVILAIFSKLILFAY
jgi:hypothetical protein